MVRAATSKALTLFHSTIVSQTCIQLHSRFGREDNRSTSIQLLVDRFTMVGPYRCLSRRLSSRVDDSHQSLLPPAPFRSIINSLAASPASSVVCPLFRPYSMVHLHPVKHDPERTGHPPFTFKVFNPFLRLSEKLDQNIQYS